MLNENRTARYRVALEKRKAELLQQSELSAEGRAPVMLDQQAVGRVSRVDAMQQQEMAKAQEHQRLRELVRIENAFSRIKEEVFGYCEDCGEDIPAGRLEIDPSVRLCVRCAERA